MNKPNHLTLKQAFKHLCVREYMTGVARTKDRVKATGEVFTPDALVKEMIEKVIERNPTMFSDPEKIMLDPSCGDGQFLAWGVIYKLCAGDLRELEKPEADTQNVFNEYIRALDHVLGIDLMPDNIAECYRRLSCGFNNKRIKSILKRNVLCGNALKIISPTN